MEITELVEIALANVDRNRVEVAALEPAEVAKEAMGGFTQLLTELVDNAIAFSGPDDKVGVTGVFDRDDYIVSITDHGVGVPESLLPALNRVLSNPRDAQTESGPSIGIHVVARIAARHGIDVRMVPAVPGTTARVTIPASIVSPAGESTSSSSPSEPAGEPIDLDDPRLGSGHVVAMTESARREAEAFLEKVFGPLRGHTASRRPARKRSNANNGTVNAPALGSQERPESPPGEGRGGRLETRVPGANYPNTDDDPSVVSGEAAIDIQLNLSRYDEGRRQATDSDPDG